MKNPKNLLLDEVLEKLHANREAHDEIYNDYLEGDSKMLEAIMVADKEFTNEIENLKDEEGFDIAEAIRNSDDTDCDLILKAICEISDDDEVLQFMNAKGYAFIKLDSLADRMKLEDFIKAEIYPHYNDEIKYSI